MIPPFEGGAAANGAAANGAAGVASHVQGDAAREIIAGLRDPHPFVSPKFFYDVLGSRLFEAITALPEYYPTRTETGILARYSGEIAAAAGAGLTLIELGAGNCEKARRLLDVLRPVQYVAVDISVEFLQAALAGLRRDCPDLDIVGVGADLASEIEFPAEVLRERRLLCYLGSSIGNFTPPGALALLERMRRLCPAGGGVLIGVDLVKSESVLHAAYNDSLGVTAAFNLNLLNHLNALIGSDFEIRDWRHCAFFNPSRSRIEMHLEAQRDLVVRWPGGEREFARGQRLHTENSYKYRLQDFKGLLEHAGFSRIDAWTDDRQWFAVYYAKA